MLLRMLKSFGRAKAGKSQSSSAAGRERADESPAEYVARLNAAHGSSPIDAHLGIVYGGLRVGDHDLLTLVKNCLRDSHAVVPPAKAFHRPLASFFLARYFLHSLDIVGERAECGVFVGTSSLLLCRAAQSRDASYAGAGLHLIDSFEGFDEPRDEDRFATRDGEREVTMGKGGMAASIDYVHDTLKDFPGVSYHQGWIPAVFGGLAEAPWSFVHLDVDHYGPTYAGLAYFYPRLSPGGVIVCDDYGAPTFPGARRAWDQYCDGNDVPYVVLDTGQSVILKGTPKI